jgi:hypothetical protein
MTDFHPAPFDAFSTELRDPWPVVERLRMALREAERYCLGAENTTGHCITDLLNRQAGEHQWLTCLPLLRLLRLCWMLTTPLLSMTTWGIEWQLPPPCVLLRIRWCLKSLGMEAISA